MAYQSQENVHQSELQPRRVSLSSSTSSAAAVLPAAALVSALRRDANLEMSWSDSFDDDLTKSLGHNRPSYIVTDHQCEGNIRRDELQPRRDSLSLTCSVATSFSQSSESVAGVHRNLPQKRSRPSKSRNIGSPKRRRIQVPVADHVVVLGKCMGSNPTKASLVYHEEVRSLLKHVEYEVNDLQRIKNYLHKRLRKTEGIKDRIPDDPNRLEIVVIKPDEQPRIERPITASEDDLVRDIKNNAGPKRKSNDVYSDIQSLLSKKLQERQDWIDKDFDESSDRRHFTKVFERYVYKQMELYPPMTEGALPRAVLEEQDACVIKSVNNVWRKTLEQYVLRDVGEDSDKHHELDKRPDSDSNNEDKSNGEDQAPRRDTSDQEPDEEGGKDQKDTRTHGSGPQGRQVREYDEWSEDGLDDIDQQSGSDEDENDYESDGSCGSAVSSLTPLSCDDLLECDSIDSMQAAETTSTKEPKILCIDGSKRKMLSEYKETGGPSCSEESLEDKITMFDEEFHIVPMADESLTETAEITLASEIAVLEEEFVSLRRETTSDKTFAEKANVFQSQLDLYMRNPSIWMERPRA